MVTFPNCKINLGLHVTSKREDGYHNIETVFYPVPIKDALELITSNELSFEFSGLKIEAALEHNLCWTAYHLLQKDFSEVKPIKVHLHKAIPMGAGLGGGSGNGAFMLQMLNEKFHLQLSQEALMNYALQLGSDCPFFIINKPCFATGRGENLQPLNVDLSMYDMMIVNPDIHVSTADAFAKLHLYQTSGSLQFIVQQPVEKWKDELVNDFEQNIFQLHPPIREIKDELYSQGALYASMTGTGSTVYGIFEKNANLQFSFPENYNVIMLKATA